MARNEEDYVQIVQAGGCLVINARRLSVDELESIARAATGRGVHITLHGVDRRANDELVRVAEAGQGAVTFDFCSMADAP